MKILIPIDFSKLSNVALDYAIKMSKKIDAELILLHITYAGGPARTTLRSKSIENQISDNANNDCNRLIDQIQLENKNQINITYKIIQGYPINEKIEELAINNNIDLIIMGTKGASGVKKILFGSNTTAVIQNSSIPVLAVPEFARYHGLKKIVYATDLSNLRYEIDLLIPFAEIFNAMIHVLYIKEPRNKNHDYQKYTTYKLKKMFVYPKIKFHSIVHENIIIAVNDYIADVDGDILTMFTDHQSFFEKIFTKSITKNVAFQTRIPLLSFHKGRS